MKNKILGIACLLPVLLAAGIATFMLFTRSVALGVVYAAALPTVALTTIFHYCRKCPHVPENSCVHMVPGLIARRLFPPAIIASGENLVSYTKRELFMAFVPLTALILFPQYWLATGSVPIMITYWALMLTALLTVIGLVCPICKNKACMFCRSGCSRNIES